MGNLNFQKNIMRFLEMLFSVIDVFIKKSLLISYMRLFLYSFKILKCFTNLFNIELIP